MFAAAFAAFALAAPAGLTIDDMLAMRRVTDPDVSADGRHVVFAVRETDVEKNRGRFDLWLLRLDAEGRATDTRRLTSHSANDTDGRFSADGKHVYFLSSRSETSQVWRIAVDGGEAEQVTDLPLDVNGFRLFPDGKRLLLALDVYPDAKTLADTKKRDDEVEGSKVKARRYDELLYRHWDSWEDGKRGHLFVFTPGAKGEPVDLMAGLNIDSPVRPFGGMEDTAISNDGKTVVYAARDVGKSAAWSTNVDLFAVPSDGKGKRDNLTQKNQAWDGVPVFSPDGKTLAYLAMARPGYEADRTRITLLDWKSRKISTVADAWDRSPGDLTWSADGKTLFTSADNVGNHSLFSIDVATSTVKTLVDKGTNFSPQPSGDRLLFARDTLSLPVELFSVRPDGSALTQLTTFNAERLKNIAWGRAEQFSFTGAHGDTVYGWIVEPSGGIKKGQKVPVAFLIHGGPQGSFGDHFHYRWNPQVFAGHGYAAIMIDFHGSTGYGQNFTDAIRGDWGGAPYDDLMKGLDAALVKYPWLDGKRVAALGASYGGFMINWINGNTDRFRALVCHDGNLDERMAYYDTEELWFPEWEHHGAPWEQGASYGKHNPIEKVANWKTPTLVIHGANDFRVVDTQGMSTFTALQRRGVPSRFLHFPDENHWVLKPQNSKRWHTEVFAWIDQYTK